VKTTSIARKLITTVLLVELVSALCVTGLAMVYERHTHFRAFDIMLRGHADTLIGAVQDAEDQADNVMLDQTGLSLPSEDIYEVRDAGGRLLGRSPNWQGPQQSLITPSTDSIFKIRIHDRHYRMLRLHGLRIVDPGDKGGGVPRHVTVLYGSPTKRVWNAIYRAVEFYALASFLLLVITGLLMAWLLHRSMLPLRQLAAEASGVSVDAWHFHPPESALTTRELAPLTLALEAVLQRLERSFTQQRHFVGDAAHELKTAVAVVKSSLQLLSMRQRTPHEYQEGLERCLEDCARMEETVAKMLTLARVENHRQHAGPFNQQTNLTETVQLVVDQLRSVAELRLVHISITAPEACPVQLSPDDCNLLCTNLLLNALQHSPPGSQINLSVTQQDQIVQLQIEDQGDGIDPSSLPHIFERFYRGDPSRNRNTGGTGLGLAISKAIVESAHGNIALTSTVGIGTTVTAHFPLAIANSAALLAQTAEQTLHPSA
jgi:signal transduction histidine kinase